VRPHAYPLQPVATGAAALSAPRPSQAEGSVKLVPLAKLKTVRTRTRAHARVRVRPWTPHVSELSALLAFLQVSCDSVLFGSNKATRLSDHFGVEATLSVPKPLG
jgi:hypothetical protein